MAAVAAPAIASAVVTSRGRGECRREERLRLPEPPPRPRRLKAHETLSLATLLLRAEEVVADFKRESR